MVLENGFEVAASRDDTWSLLSDVPRVVPCMPGATLSEVVDEDQWKAMLKVNIGPVCMAFDTDVQRVAVDEERGRVELTFKAREKRNRGSASGNIESIVSSLDGLTKVDIRTDIKVSGAVARYGSGMFEEISASLVDQFSEAIREELVPLDPSSDGAPTARPTESNSIPMVGLVLRTYFKRLRRTWARLRGGSPA